MAEISGFRLTEKSWPVLKGEQPVRFRKDAQPLKVAKAARAAASPVADIGDEGSQSLFEKLRRLRLDIAQRLGVAPYVVFHDKTLKEMAVVRPSTPAELLGITGVGERKLELYGALFLSAIQGVESDVSENDARRSSPGLLRSNASPTENKRPGTEAAGKEFNNAYKPWTESEDALLKEKFAAGAGIDELASALGRERGAIRSRLNKLKNN